MCIKKYCALGSRSCRTFLHSTVWCLLLWTTGTPTLEFVAQIALVVIELWRIAQVYTRIMWILKMIHTAQNIMFGKSCSFNVVVKLGNLSLLALARFWQGWDVLTRRRARGNFPTPTTSTLSLSSDELLGSDRALRDTSLVLSLTSRCNEYLGVPEPLRIAG